MSTFTVFDPKKLEVEIENSHERSRRYGVDPKMLIPSNQMRISDAELVQRREADPDFSSIVLNQIDELCRLFAGENFALGYADNEGFILYMTGDAQILGELEKINCKPGYRWSERDVGTSSVALCVERQIPVQITQRQCFCSRGHGYTNSAAPIFHGNGKLAGVIFITGMAEQFHPHTLGMMITAAKSIEDQIKLLIKSRELMIRNSFMNAVIESIDSGVIAVNSQGIIIQANAHAIQILGLKAAPVGKQVYKFIPDFPELETLEDSETAFIDRESFYKSPQGGIIQALTTIRPIRGPLGKIRGVIVVFLEINRIRKIVNEMAGLQASFTFWDIIGSSPSLIEAKKLAMKVARGSSSVLLTGETGSGKELFAQAIHNQSNRRRRPFVAINCGAIPRELLESEFFGYAEGAFTGARRGGRPGKFELGDGGTVFLDEIGDMPRDMQVKLLRVLQSGEVIRIGESRAISVNLRIIAATNKDIKREVFEGNFREDLFYRLNVFPIHIPALRERPEDILQIANHILSRSRQTFGKPTVSFSKSAEELLKSYNWPGNVRELENVVERAVNLVDEDRIENVHLSIHSEKKAQRNHQSGENLLLANLEKKAIVDALKCNCCNIAKTAQTLGITRPTIYRKLKKYQIPIVKKER